MIATDISIVSLSSFGGTTKTEEPKKDLSKEGPPSCLHVPPFLKLFRVELDRNSNTCSDLLDWVPSEKSSVPRFLSDLDDDLRSSLTFQE